MWKNILLWVKPAKGRRNWASESEVMIFDYYMRHPLWVKVGDSY